MDEELGECGLAQEKSKIRQAGKQYACALTAIVAVPRVVSHNGDAPGLAAGDLLHQGERC